MFAVSEAYHWHNIASKYLGIISESDTKIQRLAERSVEETFFERNGRYWGGELIRWKGPTKVRLIDFDNCFRNERRCQYEFLQENTISSVQSVIQSKALKFPNQNTRGCGSLAPSLSVRPLFATTARNRTLNWLYKPLIVICTRPIFIIIIPDLPTFSSRLLVRHCFKPMLNPIAFNFAERRIERRWWHSFGASDSGYEWRNRIEQWTHECMRSGVSITGFNTCRTKCGPRLRKKHCVPYIHTDTSRLSGIQADSDSIWNYGIND